MLQRGLETRNSAAGVLPPERGFFLLPLQGAGPLTAEELGLQVGVRRLFCSQSERVRLSASGPVHQATWSENNSGKQQLGAAVTTTHHLGHQTAPSFSTISHP